MSGVTKPLTPTVDLRIVCNDSSVKSKSTTYANNKGLDCDYSSTLAPTTEPHTPTADLCVVCNEELRCQPVLSRLPCGHVFCPPCLGEWASYLASKRQTPTCPLCRGSAQITELVPRRVLLDNYGNVRPSKSRPGYLHERPGRKALPFHKDGGGSHHKNSRTDDKVATEKTTRKLTATAEARRYARCIPQRRGARTVSNQCPRQDP